jgi:hypothetical protein
MWMQAWESGTVAYVQSYPTWQTHGIYKLDKDDTVHVEAFSEGGNYTISNGTQTYFQGFQIA